MNKYAVQEGKSELYFGAGIISRRLGNTEEYRIVKDSCKFVPGKINIKLPGGMQDDCDYDQGTWIKKLKSMLCDPNFSFGFSEEEIIKILSFEKDMKRKMTDRGAIKEILEEAGVYARAIEHVHYYKKHPPVSRKNDSCVHMNFYFVQEYIVPKNPPAIFIPADKDVKGRVWVSGEELLDKDPENSMLIKLIPSHQNGLMMKQSKLPGIISKEIVL